MIFQDQLNRPIEIESTPKRIISLVPSITELLCDLGLEDRIVGCTKFCVHPQHLRKRISIIGGTKTIHLDRVQQLRPDLIIANKEENTKSDIEHLANEYPVWISDVQTRSESLELIRQLGELCGCSGSANRIINQLEKSHLAIPKLATKKVAYLIWKSPYMTIGADTFIHSMLEAHGFVNVFAERQRYPEVTLEEISRRKPELIFLSSEPFPFKEDHLREIQEILGDSKVLLVDGEYFSWYGSRQLHLPEYIIRLNHKIESFN